MRKTETNDEAKKQCSDKLKMINDADLYLRMKKSGDMSTSIEWISYPDVAKLC